MEEAINMIMQGYDMIGQGLQMLQGGQGAPQNAQQAPVDLNAILAAAPQGGAESSAQGGSEAQRG